MDRDKFSTEEVPVGDGSEETVTVAGIGDEVAPYTEEDGVLVADKDAPPAEPPKVEPPAEPPAEPAAPPAAEPPAEPATPPVEPPAEPGAEPPAEPVEPPADPDDTPEKRKGKKTASERIGEVIEQRNQERDKNARLQTRLDGLEQRMTSLAQGQQPPAQPGQPPAPVHGQPPALPDGAKPLPQMRDFQTEDGGVDMDKYLTSRDEVRDHNNRISNEASMREMLNQERLRDRIAVRDKGFETREAAFVATLPDQGEYLFRADQVVNTIGNPELIAAATEAIAESDMGPQMIMVLSERLSDLRNAAASGSPIALARFLGQIEAETNTRYSGATPPVPPAVPTGAQSPTAPPPVGQPPAIPPRQPNPVPPAPVPPQAPPGGTVQPGTVDLANASIDEYEKRRNLQQG